MQFHFVLIKFNVNNNFYLNQFSKTLHMEFDKHKENEIYKFKDLRISLYYILQLKTISL